MTEQETAQTPWYRSPRDLTGIGVAVAPFLVAAASMFWTIELVERGGRIHGEWVPYGEAITAGLFFGTLAVGYGLHRWYYGR